MATLSNLNMWLGRRLDGATTTYEYFSPYGGYHSFVNASNNWRRTTIYGEQTPYNPGTNYRLEQWSTIGC